MSGDRQNGLDRQRSGRKSRIEDLRKQIENFNTQSGQRERRLKTLSDDTFKAWQWIQKNQALFEKPILGHPAIECTIENQNMATAIESFLQKNDFKFITAQTDNDYTLLQRKLNVKQGLHDISLRTCSEESLNAYHCHKNN